MSTTISSRTFNQRINEAKKASKEGPVFITRRGRPEHVLLSIEAYARLTGGGQSMADLLAEPSGIAFDAPKLDDLAQAADFT